MHLMAGKDSCTKVLAGQDATIRAALKACDPALPLKMVQKKLLNLLPLGSTNQFDFNF